MAGAVPRRAAPVHCDRSGQGVTVTDPPRVTVAGSLSEVEPARWASLATGWPVELSHAWLRAEEGRTAAAQWYLLAWRPDGRLLGALAAYLFDGPITHTAYPVQSVLRGTSQDLDPALHPSLVCVAPGSYRPGLLSDRTLDPESTMRVREALLTAFEEHARDLGCAAISVMHVSGGDTGLAGLLAGRGYAKALVSADAVLRVPAGSFPDYLATLPPDRRRKVRRERRTFLDSGVTVHAGGAELLTESLAPLLVDHYRRYGHPADERGVLDRFHRVRRQGELRVFLARAGDEIAGFSAFFTDGADRLVGRLYAARSAGAFEYFNLVYYEPITAAARDGIRAIHYGSESFDAKVFRGCTLRPLYGHFGSVAGHAGTLSRMAYERCAAERTRLRDFVPYLAE
ncbi:hypothetical protein C6361_34450 [Plantactinospora sp. BC1]|nr:hypothetical protein C6361_34450 [Plantactinospora sp. BC1]